MKKGGKGHKVLSPLCPSILAINTNTRFHVGQRTPERLLLSLIVVRNCSPQFLFLGKKYPLSFPDYIFPEYRDGIDNASASVAWESASGEKGRSPLHLGSGTSVLQWFDSTALPPLSSYIQPHSPTTLLILPLEQGSQSLIQLKHSYLERFSQCGRTPKSSLTNC